MDCINIIVIISWSPRVKMTESVLDHYPACQIENAMRDTCQPPIG